MTADAQQMARIFKAFSTAARVQIVQLLKDRNLCVNALAGHLEVSSAAVSQHLRILRDANLVVAEKQGYYVHYRINPETLQRWGQLVDGLLSTEPTESTGASMGNPSARCQAGKKKRLE